MVRCRPISHAQVLDLTTATNDVDVNVDPSLKVIAENVHSDTSLTVHGDNDVMIVAGGGNDQVDLRTRPGTISCWAVAGDDVILGGHGADSIYGGKGDDSLMAGTGGHQLLVGGGGNDTLTGGDGSHDTLLGGHGNDLMIAGNGDHQLLVGGYGSDTMQGGAGSHDFTLRRPR